MSPSNNDARNSPPPEPASSPPPHHRRSVTTRSSFDLEPNPFEQSFSNTRSSSSNDEKLLSDSPKHNSDSSKPVLPSLAALSSPSDGYSWSDIAGSLRSGPLSPAMLQRPQQPHQQQSTPGMNLSSYDPTRFPRTGLTPSTGLTPLVGGPASFPPPSPNTAAFLAMVTNSNSTSQINPAPATITPNTLSAITGIINNPGVAPSATTSSSNAAGITSATSGHQQQQQQQQSLSVSHIPTQGYQYSQQSTQNYAPGSAAGAANAAANGLFLLSQAHQELTKREEAQAARAGAGAVDSSNKRNNNKRKSIDVPPVPAVRTPASKRQRSNTTRNRRRKASTGSPEEDEDSLDEDDTGTVDNDPEPHANGSKKPETEEEKRRNFLERNRQAALKCRQRKKAWLASLQAKNEFLENENARLTCALVSSREEISRLAALVGAAGAAPQPPTTQPVSVAVTLPPASKSVQSQAPQGPPVSVVTNGRGYGY